MQIHLFVCFPQPGQSFEKFKEKMKEFDEDKNKKFRKEEVKNILAKLLWTDFFSFEGGLRGSF